MMRIRRVDLRFIFVLCIALPTALLTPFRNKLTLTMSRADSNDVNFIVQSDSDRFEAKLPFGEPSEIQGSFQRSMAGKTALSALTLSKSDSTTDLVAASGVYIFGHPIGYGFASANAENFTPSFGDWTIDRYEGAAKSIAQINTPLPLTLDATVLGRGTTHLILVDHEMRRVKISLDDGFIDNAIHICDQSGCPADGQLNERIGLNISRVINVIAQAAIFAVLIWAVASILAKLDRTSLKPIPVAIFNFATVFLIALHAVLVFAFSSGVLGAIAHLPDSAIYVRQAILLGHGMFAAPLPPAQPFEAFLSNSAVINNGVVLYQHASHFWPLFLAPFTRFGAMSLVNPLMAFFSISSLAYLVRAYWGPKQACLAILFYALSPFVFVNYGDFMMHGFCSMLVLLCLACITRFEQVRRRKWVILAGFFAGYCFGARQITAIALAAPLLIVWIVKLRAREQMAPLRLFLLGALPCGIGFLYNNYLVTGSAWRSIYASLHGLSLSWGNLPIGLGMGDSMLGYLDSILLPSIAPSFALGLAVFGLLSEWSRRNLVLAISFASLFFIHLFLNTNGLHGYGPRFLFEASPALLVLAALGMYSILKRTPIWGSLLLCFYLCFAVVRLNHGLREYRNYNGVSQGNFNTAKTFHGESTILRVHGDRWQALDTYAGLFDPTWKGLLVIRALDDGSDRQIIEAFPNRQVRELN